MKPKKGSKYAAFGITAVDKAFYTFGGNVVNDQGWVSSKLVMKFERKSDH